MSSFSTGDLQNNVEKLRRVLRSIKYSGIFDVPGIVGGEPECFLPLLDFATMGFSRHVAKDIVSNGYDFYTRTDASFINGLFKFVREQTPLSPQLQPSHFLRRGFSEHKIIFLCQLIHHLKKKHNEIVKQKQEKRNLRRLTSPRKRKRSSARGRAGRRTRMPSSSSSSSGAPPNVRVTVQKELPPASRSATVADYDPDPCTHVIDPIFLEEDAEFSDVESSPPPLAPTFLESSPSAAPSGSGSGSDMDIRHFLTELKSEILDSVEKSIDQVRKEFRVRFQLFEGRIGILESRIRKAEERGVLQQTERVIGEASAVAAAAAAAGGRARSAQEILRDELDDVDMSPRRRSGIRSPSRNLSGINVVVMKSVDMDELREGGGLLGNEEDMMGDDVDEVDDFVAMEEVEQERTHVVRMTPKEIQRRTSGTATATAVGTGTRDFIQKMRRKNRKTLDLLED